MLQFTCDAQELSWTNCASAIKYETSLTDKHGDSYTKTVNKPIKLCWNNKAFGYWVNGLQEILIIDHYDKGVSPMRPPYMQETLTAKVSGSSPAPEYMVFIIYSKPAQITIQYVIYPGFSYNFYTNELPVITEVVPEHQRAAPYMDSFYNDVAIKAKMADSLKAIQSEADAINDDFKYKNRNPIYLKCAAKPGFDLKRFLAQISKENSGGYNAKPFNCNFTFDIDSAGNLSNPRNLKFEYSGYGTYELRQKVIDKITPSIIKAIGMSPRWIPAQNAFVGSKGVRVDRKESIGCSCNLWITK